jgi:potassium-transporting ATPase ATP-binding subunit
VLLAKVDVGLAMNTGTTAAKEADNMVDLDSNPTKFDEVGKQVLITRGALTVFSIVNDVAEPRSSLGVCPPGLHLDHAG